MEMTTAKTLIVFGIIFGCFAILYPKIFHPMLAHLTGFQGEGSVKSEGSHNEMLDKMPPHLRKGPAKKPSAADDITRHMKPGPHPGLRAAAEMKKQAATTTGAGKGMMSVVLPMYAVGIVVYLIYTLSKVFGKKNSADKESEFMGSHHQGVRYNAEQQKFLSAADPEEEDSDHGCDQEFREYRRRKKQQRNLERLLLKADKNDINDLELHELKRRLLETESQMSRILEAMSTVEDNVNDVVSDEPEGDIHSEQTPENIPSEEEKLNLQKPAKSEMVDSSPSPDIETYEIIDKSNSKTDLDEDLDEKSTAGEMGSVSDDNENEHRDTTDGKLVSESGNIEQTCSESDVSERATNQVEELTALNQEEVIGECTGGTEREDENITNPNLRLRKTKCSDESDEEIYSTKL